jgi:hypothetical protein
VHHTLSFPIIFFAPAVMVIVGLSLCVEIQHTTTLREDVDRRKRERLQADNEVDVPLV